MRFSELTWFTKFWFTTTQIPCLKSTIWIKTGNGAIEELGNSKNSLMFPSNLDYLEVEVLESGNSADEIRVKYLIELPHTVPNKYKLIDQAFKAILKQ